MTQVHGEGNAPLPLQLVVIIVLKAQHWPPSDEEEERKKGLHREGTEPGRRSRKWKAMGKQRVVFVFLCVCVSFLMRNYRLVLAG